MHLLLEWNHDGMGEYLEPLMDSPCIITLLFYTIISVDRLINKIKIKGRQIDWIEEVSSRSPVSYDEDIANLPPIDIRIVYHPIPIDITMISTLE